MLSFIVRFLGVTVLLCLCEPSIAQHTSDATVVQVVLGTNSPSAYSADKSADSLGESAQLVRCVFSYLPQEVALHVQPWRRVQREVLSGVSDGFFTAMEDPRINQYASLTDPLVLQKWYWFSRADTALDADPTTLRGGTILGSQQQLWYELNGYDNTLAAQDLPQLIKLLFAGRIDVILADRGHFNEATSALNVSADQYREKFFRYVPLGVYVGHHFSAKNPNFIAAFNHQIPQCVPEGFALSPHEQALVRQRISPYFEHWLTAPVLFQALKKYNLKRAGLAQPDVQKRDQQWQEAYRLGNTDALDSLLATALMKHVSQWHAEDKLGYIREIIITDKRGMNVAARPYSSNYWQGQEAKFLQTITLAEGQWFFDTVQFDSSSRYFQVQVSVPITQGKTTVGVITLGIDIERALHQAESTSPQ